MGGADEPCEGEWREEWDVRRSRGGGQRVWEENVRSGAKGAEEAGDRWNLLTGIGWNGEEGWGGRRD